MSEHYTPGSSATLIFFLVHEFLEGQKRVLFSSQGVLVVGSTQRCSQLKETNTTASHSQLRISSNVVF